MPGYVILAGNSILLAGGKCSGFSGSTAGLSCMSMVDLLLALRHRPQQQRHTQTITASTSTAAAMAPMIMMVSHPFLPLGSVPVVANVDAVAAQYAGDAPTPAAQHRESFSFII